MTNETLQKEQEERNKAEEARMNKLLPQIQKELDVILDKYNVRLLCLLNKMPDGMVTQLAVVPKHVPDKVVKNPIPTNPYKIK